MKFYFNREFLSFNPVSYLKNRFNKGMFFLVYPIIVLFFAWVADIFNLGLGFHNLKFATTSFETLVYHFNNNYWFYFDEFIKSNTTSLVHFGLNYFLFCLSSFIFFELLMYIFLKVVFIFFTNKKNFTLEGMLENKKHQFGEKHSQEELVAFSEKSLVWVDLLKRS